MNDYLAQIPIFLVFIPVVFSIIIYLFKAKWTTYLAFISQVLLLIAFFAYLSFWRLHPGDHLLVFGGWSERIGISFFHDGLSLTFSFLAIFIFSVILMYLFKFRRKDHKFFFFFLFLEGIFLGMIQTNDLFNMFVFLELTTVLVTVLISYQKTGPSFQAGIYYLLLNTVGALFFLIGIVFLYNVFGTINIRVLQELIGTQGDRTVVKFAYVIMMSGISVKAALFPLFTWLPKAHGVAQSGISALLSGLVVKGALYVLIRMDRFLFVDASFQMNEMFFWIGVVTAIVGVTFAISQKDMKQILAYHTVSQVGIMMMGISQIGLTPFYGGVLHIINHALFKSLLFLGAGILIKHYQTKKVYEIKGAFKTFPIVAVMLIIAMLSISGAPLFNGFVSKSMIKYAVKGNFIKEALFFLINLGTVTSFIKFSSVLFGPKALLVKEKNPLQIISVIVLGLSCLGIGLFYQVLASSIFGITISTNLWEISHFLDYGLFLVLGFLFYRFVVKKDYLPFQKIRHFKLTFESANYMFVVYLLVILGVVFL
jgi:multicomponent Na+:H+ antiporter subunit D